MPVDDPFAQRYVSRALSSAISARGQFRRDAEADDAGDVFGRRAQAALLSAAVNDRLSVTPSRT